MKSSMNLPARLIFCQAASEQNHPRNVLRLISPLNCFRNISLLNFYLLLFVVLKELSANAKHY
jgi:hypothetical protein